jgi:hypothetical protein
MLLLDVVDALRANDVRFAIAGATRSRCTERFVAPWI